MHCAYALTVSKVSGAEKAQNVLPLISSEEKQLLEACKTGLKGSIDKGVEFVTKSPETR